MKVEPEVQNTPIGQRKRPMFRKPKQAIEDFRNELGLR
jgi:hypothetical protein